MCIYKNVVIPLVLSSNIIYTQGYIHIYTYVFAHRARACEPCEFSWLNQNEEED